MIYFPVDDRCNGKPRGGEEDRVLPGALGTRGCQQICLLQGGVHYCNVSLDLFCSDMHLFICVFFFLASGAAEKTRVGASPGYPTHLNTDSSAVLNAKPYSHMRPFSGLLQHFLWNVKATNDFPGNLHLHFPASSPGNIRGNFPGKVILGWSVGMKPGPLQ